MIILSNLKLNVFFLLLFCIALFSNTGYALQNKQFSCSAYDKIRTVDLIYMSKDESIPCRVIYKKPTEIPGFSQYIAKYDNEKGQCEQRLNRFLKKLSGWGWKCSIVRVEVSSHDENSPNVGQVDSERFSPQDLWIHECPSGRLLKAMVNPLHASPGDTLNFTITAYAEARRAQEIPVQIVLQDGPADKPMTIEEGQTNAAGEFFVSWQIPPIITFPDSGYAIIHVYAFDVQKQDCSFTFAIQRKEP